ncbi:MAG: type II toxin-antitoxin system death-on-curing family toxin [Candidatus Micrarchaeota archaeon]|nr:type II toxin-antitoxin system death-on-curing family toxin [Candidatus Micrarchaeota archaeon]
MTIYLTKEQIIRINKEVGADGTLVNEGNLEFIVSKVQSLKADINHKAAIYLYEIINMHPFLDGNKRTGFISAVLFLELNGLKLAIRPSEKDTLERFIYEISQNKLGIEKLTKFIKKSVQNEG